MKEANAYIDKIHFKQTAIDLDPESFVVIVGPNNSGKSATLLAINEYLKYGFKENPLIKKLETKLTVSKDNLVEFLSKHSVCVGSRPNRVFSGYSYAIHEANLTYYHKQIREDGTLNDLSSFFCQFLNTEERLSAVKPPQSIPLTTKSPSHPIHVLYKDDEIEKSISHLFNKAFGEHLIVHRGAGSEVPLYVGPKPELSNNEDRVSVSYLKRLEGLPKLHEQGDGMKCYAAILLNTMVKSKDITLIDEPEAFLHPPQAYLLGQVIASKRVKNKQTFIATHSGDFLRGVINADLPNLKILRISRNNNENQITELDRDQISEIWSDPLLRHSNILEGLFHKQVVICEGDSDCRFYSAIAEANYQNNNKQYPDTLYVHCGGKHKIPTVVKALKQLDVNVSTVVDFDILNNQNPLKEIFENHGGDWSLIENDWKLVKTTIEQTKPETSATEIKDKLNSILNSIDTNKEPIFPTVAKKQIDNLLKKSSTWDHAKKSGINAVPAGDANQAAKRLISECEKLGIFIVHLGQLESFDKSCGGHGSRWINNVFSKDLTNDQDLEEARKFIAKIV